MIRSARLRAGAGAPDHPAIPPVSTTGPGTGGPAATVAGTPLETCREQLDVAIEAGGALGLDTTDAEDVAAELTARLGMSAEVYVLALVGGTGVGKSSLLNALAGQSVTRVGARRPTTDAPVAWIPAGAGQGVAALLDRLDVTDRREHAGHNPDNVVILDLPDMDSIEAEHRARVEELLPRLDAVAWVTDPEKYADALLHDAFLRRWIPRLDRQLLVLNKADRLDQAARDLVRRDLERTVSEELARATDRIPHAATPPVLLASAIGGEAGVADVRAWLAAAADAKAIVARRLGAAVLATLDDLADAAGVAGVADLGAGPDVPHLLDPDRRDEALEDATAETLRLVDLDGARRQAVAATRAAARPRGAGPLGRVTAFVYRASGRERQVADPAGYLARWRERGSLARAVEPLRAATASALESAPPALRPGLARVADPGAVAVRLGAAADRAIARHGPLAAPTSRVWTLAGLLQTAAVATIVFAAAWLVLWLVARPPADTVTLPVLGPVPVPLALLVLALATGYLLARLLALHAGWLGRRWARRIEEEVRASVAGAVAEDAFAGLDLLDDARARLAAAHATARARCTRG